ncbi:MAG: sensory rhodopsin transducer [Clostridia bacterium]
MAGKNSWYIVDGYRPPVEKGGATYEGHEAIMILNPNTVDAHCQLDLYFMDRAPVLGIAYTAPAQRVSCFRTNDKHVFGEVALEVNQQYSLCVRSDVGVIVQYGRCDINQDNLAYIATMGYAQ